MKLRVKYVASEIAAEAEFREDDRGGNRVHEEKRDRHGLGSGSARDCELQTAMSGGHW